MQQSNYTYLRFVPFKDVIQWDLKRYFSKSIVSKYPIEYLKTNIKEEKQKFQISDKNCDYGILGVNNQTGIFDAYVENGSKIKQKYKKMEVGWIAYNPYRVNVGSIGIKKNLHQYDYISPAYVVFSCRETLLPDYLFFLMKTPKFNQIIRDNTTGSVRQNLSYDILQDLQIPLPTLAEQEAIVAAYNAKVAQAEQLEAQAIELEADIEAYLLKTLGINYEKQTTSSNSDYQFLKFVDFKDVDEWGVDKILNKSKISSKKYITKKVKDICSVGSGGTPSRSYQHYYTGNIPWIKTGEVLDNIIMETEEHISQEAIDNSSAKLYKNGSLIIAMYGQGNTRGRTAKLGIDATTNQACAVLFDINNEVLATDYLWYYLQSQYNNLRSMASGNNQPNLNAEKIKNYNIVTPPLSVQNEIVEHINAQKEQIKICKSQAAQLRAQALADFEKEIFE